MKTEYIYTLRVTDLNGNPVPELANRDVFYVGRTKHPLIREKQHRSSSRLGHEDKYAYIRELHDLGYDFTLEVIKEIDPQDFPPDYERWYVIDYTRKGNDLQNMKHGDAAKRKELAEQVDNLTIRSVSEVTTDRLKREQAITEKRSEKLKTRILKEEEDAKRQAEFEARMAPIRAEREARRLQQEYEAKQAKKVAAEAKRKVEQQLEELRLSADQRYYDRKMRYSRKEALTILKDLYPQYFDPAYAKNYYSNVQTYDYWLRRGIERIAENDDFRKDKDCSVAFEQFHAEITNNLG